MKEEEKMTRTQKIIIWVGVILIWVCIGLGTWVYEHTPMTLQFFDKSKIYHFIQISYEDTFRELDCTTQEMIL